MATLKRVGQFDIRSFLESSGVEKETIEFPPNAVIYRQGDPAWGVTYVQKDECRFMDTDIHQTAAFATCPLCHTPDLVITREAVSGGAYWRCSRCGHHWDRTRLATAAAYLASLSFQAGRPPSPPQARHDQ